MCLLCTISPYNTGYRSRVQGWYFRRTGGLGFLIPAPATTDTFKYHWDLTAKVQYRANIDA